ncbi:hypothetical protein H7171_04045 [Candidatus Saccharibacteria bacterium]|nr:hypothetical protein [Candidatus Saccharibacteria bacterium]
MDDILAQQILKQLKFLNRWIKFMTFVFVVTIVIAGVVVYKAVIFAHGAVNKVNNLQQQASQTLNVKQQLCSNSGTGALLKKDSTYCN